MATFKSAKNCKVRIGATTYTAKSWTVTYNADELDVTNAEGSGNYECITGITKLTYTVDADIDCDADPFDAPRSITAGATLSNVKLYLNDTTGPFWSIVTSRIIELTNPMAVHDSIKLSFRAVGSGAMVYPTGAI